MARLSNPPPHRYSGAGHDRAAHRRLDAAWLGERRADAATRVILMSGLEVLVSADDEPAPLLLTVAELGRALTGDAIFLGEHEGAPLFAADARPRPRRRAAGSSRCARSAPGCRRERPAGSPTPGRSPTGTPAIASAASAAGPRSASRAATSGAASGCEAQHFPRSDPAVIVLVTHEHPEFGARCLLGRSARFPAGMYSTLAGFVEPGKSLEETVRREIYEEAGVERRGRAVPLVAALAVPGLADAGLPRHRAQRPAADRSRRAGRRRLVHARAAARPRAPAGPAARTRTSIARHLIEDWLFEAAAD